MNIPTHNFQEWAKYSANLIDLALAEFIPSNAPAQLSEVIRYATLGSGKKLRPLLVLAACHAAGGHVDVAIRAACAVELIHAYSLVHDDMPCMDNDLLRRGQPTVHAKFGEAQALLAGDAMQALAFEILTPSAEFLPLELQAQLCGILARSAGYAGMAGGQALDLANIGCNLDENQLRQMHQLKTGALLQASISMGLICGQLEPQAQASLNQFGSAIGLAYQVVDDILDVTQDSVTLGKTAGKDALQKKPTYVSIMGLDAASQLAETLLQNACDALISSGLNNIEYLQELALHLIRRKH